MSVSEDPYVGPRPFELTDRGKFFGRNNESHDLRSLVVAQDLVLVYAQSGAGKSSLVNAGLAPLLAEQGFHVFPSARVYGLTHRQLGLPETGNLYLGNIVAGLQGEENTDSPQTLESFLAAAREKLASGQSPVPRLVIVDQFEELFAPAPVPEENRAEVFGALRDALASDPLLRVLLVMREEFIAALDRYDEVFPDRMRSRFRLEPLRKDAAHEAVTEPLTRTQRSFEGGAADALVRELSITKMAASDGSSVERPGEFVEPVQLQIVCQSLWRRLPPDIALITEPVWRKYADVNLALGQFYEDCLDAAVATRAVTKPELRDWVGQSLITPIDTRGTVVRGPDATGGIPNAAIDLLEAAHIIRRERRAGANWYELTHDRLIAPIRDSNAAVAVRSRDLTPVAQEGAVETHLQHGMALCLSGGGYQAMLFQVGVLWRLNDLGLLPSLRRIASVSASSITAVVLGMEWHRLDFDDNGRARSFEPLVVEPVRSLACRTIDVSLAFRAILFSKVAGNRLVEIYRRHLFGDKTLQDLPDEPRFVICATNIQSSVLWRFTKAHMRDYRVGEVKNPRVPLSQAVAASSAMIPVLSPVDLQLAESDFTPSSGLDLQRPPFTTNVTLSDGALYDDMALETVWKRYRTILVSDAAGRRDTADEEPSRNWAIQLSRTLRIRDSRLRDLRRRQVIESFMLGVRDGAYWSIDSNVEGYGQPGSLPCPADRVSSLASEAKRYKRIDPQTQKQFINLGYAISDAALRRSVEPDARPPETFPYPKAGI